MSGVAAIGEAVRLDGYALAGVTVHEAPDGDAARAAFDALPADVAVLLLTPRARSALAGHLAERPALLWVELPA